MKKIYVVFALLFSTYQALAIEVVELPLPKSDKIVVKFMFRNGSVCDPQESGDYFINSLLDG
ncbi:MAG: hypothetical protein IPP71_17330 [Bacteroidetes bacterium]|nr:hypothetical protein [Bacteroidota bacterium]